jgi:hypothetical protein
MRRRRLIPLLLVALVLSFGPKAVTHAGRPDRSWLAICRADVAQRVRVARILAEVTLGLVERALDSRVEAAR